MEIGVHVAAEDSFSGNTRHVVSAYLTFVALDENGRPHEVPDVLPETADEKRRYEEAQVRRDGRVSSR
jgi:acyl-CoA hydrolase